MLSDEYITGFFDGEGCIHSLSDDKKMAPLRIILTNTNRRIIFKIQKALEPGIITSIRCENRTKSNNNRQPIWELRISRNSQTKLNI